MNHLQDLCERTVIAGVLKHGVSRAYVAATVRTENFTGDEMRDVYAAMLEMMASKRPIDAISVFQCLELSARSRPGSLQTLDFLALSSPTYEAVKASAMHLVGAMREQ